LLDTKALLGAVPQFFTSLSSMRIQIRPISNVSRGT